MSALQRQARSALVEELDQLREAWAAKTARIREVQDELRLLHEAIREHRKRCQMFRRGAGQR